MNSNDQLDKPDVLEGHLGAVLSLTYMNDGNTLVSGSHDCSIKV